MVAAITVGQETIITDEVSCNGKEKSRRDQQKIQQNIAKEEELQDRALELKRNG